MSFILPAYWTGRFGNRMYQYLYAYYYSQINNIDMVLPSEWEGSKLFKNRPFTVVDKIIEKDLSNTHMLNNDLDNRYTILKKYYPDIEIIFPNTYDAYKYNKLPVSFVSGCFYHEAIFEKMKKTEIIKLFEFSDDVKKTDSYKKWSSRAGQYDVAHIRRDDISDPAFNEKYIQWYSTISLESYYTAFNKYGFDKNNIEFISDDYQKKWHKFRQDSVNLGWTYPEGSNYDSNIIFDWLDDFLKMYFARTIFRANSSFSWWAGFLSPTATVYSPVINESKIYGRNGLYEEINVDFIKGNSPHWFYEPGVYFSKNGIREILIDD